jgi:hypothetical protein
VTPSTIFRRFSTGFLKGFTWQVSDSAKIHAANVTLSKHYTDSRDAEIIHQLWSSFSYHQHAVKSTWTWMSKVLHWLCMWNLLASKRGCEFMIPLQHMFVQLHISNIR